MEVDRQEMAQAQSRARQDNGPVPDDPHKQERADLVRLSLDYGKQAEMSGSEKLDFEPWKGQKAIEKTTGKEYLKKHENA